MKNDIRKNKRTTEQSDLFSKDIKRKKSHAKGKKDSQSNDQKNHYKKLTTRIIVGTLVALALVFIVSIFITTNFMGSDSVVTETAYRTTISDTISTTGFVIRDEEFIAKNDKGVLVYQVSTGDKVTANGTIATIYNNETDAVNYQNICKIEDQIAELEALNGILGSSNVGLDSVNNRLDQKLTSFIQTINEREFSDIESVQSDLLTAIYRKQIITGDQKTFDSQIEQLNAEKAALETKTNDSIGSVNAKDSGYFVATVDGYENKFSVDDLSEITNSDINNIEADDIDDTKYIGKIIKGVNWYLACPVTFEQATSIKHNDASVNVKIPYASSELIPAKVISVNEFANEEKAVVILECNYMSPALAQIRNEAVEIQLETYEGLKVSKVALHDDTVSKTVTDDNGNESTTESIVQGVYVKYGSQLIFKPVYIVYSGEDFIICSETPEDEFVYNNSTVSLYDEVVVEGDDLYDGKLID